MGQNCEDMAGRERNGARGISHETDAEVRSQMVRMFLLSLTTYRVSSVVFTNDARFVLSGSDDGNVRIWKAKASEKLGVITARERAAIEYRESLKQRWQMDKQVNKIMR